jgi:hypothetical protein
MGGRLRGSDLEHLNGRAIAPVLWMAVRPSTGAVRATGCWGVVTCKPGFGGRSADSFDCLVGCLGIRHNFPVRARYGHCWPAGTIDGSPCNVVDAVVAVCRRRDGYLVDDRHRINQPPLHNFVCIITIHAIRRARSGRVCRRTTFSRHRSPEILNWL